MTVGECLDTAAAWLDAAAARIRAEQQPHPYDIYGALTARDLVYQELARLTSLVRDQNPGQYITWDDVAVLIGEDSFGRHIDSGSILAASIQVARLGREHTDFSLLTKHGTIPALIAPAATSLGIAGEIIATHINPSAAPRTRGRSNGPRKHSTRQQLDQNRNSTFGPLLHYHYRTAEGAALAAGGQRDEALGEIAKLACKTIDIDQALLRWADTWYNGEWLHLRRLVASDIPSALAQIGTAPPAVLLRALGPAAVGDRPTGPRTIRSLADVHWAVAATRMAVRQKPAQATVGLAGQVAHLGFALTVAASRFNGEDQPSPHAEHHGTVWRNVAEIGNKVSDLRDSHDATFRLELRSAAIWLRAQIRSGAFIPDPMWTDRVVAIQRDLHQLCLDLVPLLKQAAHQRRLLTVRKAHIVKSIGGIQLMNNAWQIASADHPDLQDLRRRLTVAAKLPLTAQSTAAAAPQGAQLPTPARPGLIDPEAGTAVKVAFPQPIGKAIAKARARPDQATRPAQPTAEKREDMQR